MAAWVPTEQQVAEPDTLLLADLTDLASLNASGGLLHTGYSDSQAAWEPSFVWGPGKFGASIRAVGASAGKFFYWPSDGLALGDEFTWEFWAILDASVAANWNLVAARPFMLSTPTLSIELGVGQAGMDSYWQLNPDRADRQQFAFTVPPGGFDVPAGVPANLALVKHRDGALRVLLNGEDVGGSNNFPLPTVISDGALLSGFCFSGSPAYGAAGFAVSDIRLSRTARTVGQVPVLRSLDAAFAVSSEVSKPTPPKMMGALHGFPSTTPADEVMGVIAHMRTAGAISSTPTKAGAPDATHPTLGHSGAFSYDFQLVDRTLLALKARTGTGGDSIALLMSVMSAPQVLGGDGAPAAGALLTTGMLGEAHSDSQLAPNDYVKWSQIVADHVWHYLHDLEVQMFAWSVGNEPDIGWTGTRQSWMDHYVTTVQAIRSVDPDTPIIGTEFAPYNSGMKDTWMMDWLAACVANDVVPDGLSIHDYSGDLNALRQIQMGWDDCLTANGLAAGSIPIYFGEWQQNAALNYTPGSENPLTLFQPTKAEGAAYAMAYMARALGPEVNVGSISISHITVIGQYGNGSPRVGGWATDQILGPAFEHWAIRNALVLAQQLLGDEVLTVVEDAAPGIHACVTRDSATGRIGIIAANHGWATRPARVATFDLSALGLNGSHRVQRWLVDPPHSRWDVYEDDPAGAVLDEPFQAADDTVNGVDEVSLSVPQWGSAFVAIDRLGPAPLPGLFLVGGVPAMVLAA